jgi:hypothetical protein
MARLQLLLELRLLIEEVLLLSDVRNMRELSVLTILRGDHGARRLLDSAIKPSRRENVRK